MTGDTPSPQPGDTPAPLEPHHVNDARRVTEALRTLTDAIVRGRPGEHSADLAARIEALAEEVSPHAGEALLPWAYVLDEHERRMVIRLTATEQSNAAGTTWTTFNPVAPPVDLRMDGEESVGQVALGPMFGGPPGRVHGGTLATLVDHAMGALLFHLGRASYTARLELDYLAGAPLGAELELRARVERIEGRKTHVRATISVDGEPTVRGYGLFVTMAK